MFLYAVRSHHLRGRHLTPPSDTPLVAPSFYPLVDEKVPYSPRRKCVPSVRSSPSPCTILIRGSTVLNPPTTTDVGDRGDYQADFSIGQGLVRSILAPRLGRRGFFEESISHSDFLRFSQRDIPSSHQTMTSRPLTLSVARLDLYATVRSPPSIPTQLELHHLYRFVLFPVVLSPRAIFSQIC